MKDLPNQFRIQLFAFIGIVALVLGFLVFRTSDIRPVQQAEEFYRKGEIAPTLYARKEAFNQALTLFLKADETYNPSFGTGKLQYNIGNTYYQLTEYPLSILYYKRAENLMPRSETVKRNLSQARTKAGLKVAEKQRSLLDLFLLRPYLSLPERLQLFSALTIITLILISGWLWTQKPWLSKLAGCFLLLATLFFVNLGVTHYIAPVEGVLVHAAELRRDAGMQFAQVGEEPIPGGTTVEVVGTAQLGRWLRVVTASGEFGFMPSESVKLVDAH